MPNPVRMRRLWGAEQWLDFSYDTFVAAMAKRATSVFATAPIVQGKFKLGAASKGDAIASALSPYGQGASFGNPTQQVRRLFDPYQGSVVLWFTPEWEPASSGIHYLFAAQNQVHLYLNDGWVAFGVYYDGSIHWASLNGNFAAGTRKFIVARWDFLRTLDGTNSLCVSLNDVHNFQIASAGTESTIPAAYYIGGIGEAYSADGIIEGLTIYRRPLYDGTYGVPGTFNADGPVDEIAAIHALGNGQDPCLVTGSWDVVFCLPTDATPGQLSPGNGNAWSHPHASNVLNRWTLDDGYYGGGQWALGFMNSPATVANAGSAAALDDLPIDTNFQVEGWFRWSDPTSIQRGLVGKGVSGNRGWYVILQSDDTLRASVRYDTSPSFTGATDSVRDGKWHHFCLDVVHATRTARLAVDGRWGSPVNGAGDYISDADDNMIFGGSGISLGVPNMTLGWVRLSDIQRHTPGTNFKPPREKPSTDGNTIEQWSFADGSGNASAEVSSPGNDAVLTNYTWKQQWDDSFTPALPTSLKLDGSATYVNFGSATGLDNIPSGAIMTVELWFRDDATETSARQLIQKGSWAGGSETGWNIYRSSALNSRVWLGGTFCTASIPYTPDGKWHHVVLYYDDTTKKSRMALDGVWGTASTGSGSYVADGSNDLVIGKQASAAAWYWSGAIGWIEISNNDRHGGASGDNFVPPDRCNGPHDDGNTIESWHCAEGAGNTIAATNTSPAHDGSITMGSGRWWNSPDMVSDSPDSRIYPWGYAIGSDVANDGVHQHLAGLSTGKSYVCRPVVRYEADKRGQPKIVIYDETNGAGISTFQLPWLTGTHDGGDDETELSDSSAPYWPHSLVTGVVWNITKGESATITAAGESIVGTLSGSADWDDGDVYFITPPAGWVFCEPFCFRLPTTDRPPYPASNCTHISVSLLNGAGEGVVYWEQIELLENLLDNPSMETGSGTPWIPDGWTNQGLTSGMSQQSTTVLHSGSAAMQYNATASWDGVYCVASVAVGKFQAWGGWIRATTIGGIDLRSSGLGYTALQSDLATYNIYIAPGAKWLPIIGVFRETDNANPAVRQLADAGGDIRYADDLWAFVLDDVSLTVIPASEANSLEASGIRVDGYDGCSRTPPVGILTAMQGWIRFKWTPRHSAANLAAFAGASNLPYIFRVAADANNYALIRVMAANNIRLSVTVDGVNDWATWDCTGQILASESYIVDFRWDGNWFRLIVNGELKAQVSPGVLASAPTIVYWGCDATPAHQMDATYARA